MANKYPLVSNSTSLTIQELPAGDTLLVDNLAVTGESNLTGNLSVAQNITVDGNVTVNGSINANLGNVEVENLVVEGKTNLNEVGNITITGGSNNYVLRTDGAGNLTWANIQSEIANAAGSNTYVQFNNDNLFGASANFTFDNATNTLTVQGSANVTDVNSTNVNATTGIFTTGNITNLNTEVANLGNVSNVHISGGGNGYVLATNGSGNLSWVLIDPSVSGDGGNASTSILLLASLNGGNAFSVYS
jgi:cytoskeletal protein CcmA (bactofilin family)